METDILILGAGVSGLTAGRILHEQGKQVVLFDKGRGVGGRVATRWKGSRDHVEGRWDHGAQFATFRSRTLRTHLEEWGAWEVMDPWMPSFSDPDLLRYRPLEGMNSFAKRLADPLEIHRSSRVIRLTKADSGWEAATEDGDSCVARQVISTIPMPQFRDLIQDSGWELSPEEQQQLSSVRYERCLSLLAETDSPVTLESDGYVRVDSGVLECVINHPQKGISEAPTLTAHATPDFSREWYDRDRATAASVLRAALQEFLETPLVSVQIHGWKFARAVQRIPAPFLHLSNGCILAGDGFEAGDDCVGADLHPRIESAMLSGFHAGTSLL